MKILFKKGYIPWNKGKRGLQKCSWKGKQLSKELREKISKSCKGRIAWNKGLKTGHAPWFGKKRSEETKQKIKLTQTGKKRPNTIEFHRIKMKQLWLNPDFRKEQLNRIKNFRHSEMTKQILSENHKGSKNPQWKGGSSFEPYPPAFNQQLKDKIRVRDNFICQLCGIPELELLRRLDIHHIDYNKKNCKDNNLISLCNRCNTKVNKNREYWNSYFNYLIMEKLDVIGFIV